MDKKMKLLPPMMPNFITVDMGIVGKREDGFVEKPKIPISQLTRQEAEEYGELMKQAFIEHYEMRVLASNP